MRWNVYHVKSEWINLNEIQSVLYMGNVYFTHNHHINFGIRQIFAVVDVFHDDHDEFIFAAISRLPMLWNVIRSMTHTHTYINSQFPSGESKWREFETWFSVTTGTENEKKDWMEQYVLWFDSSQATECHMSMMERNTKSFPLIRIFPNWIELQCDPISLEKRFRKLSHHHHRHHQIHRKNHLHCIYNSRLTDAYGGKKNFPAWIFSWHKLDFELSISGVPVKLWNLLRDTLKMFVNGHG